MALDSKNFIVAKRKSRAKEKGLCVDLTNIEPSDSTVEIYDHMATFFDPNISLVNPEHGREKSLSRELMSTSVRSLATHSATTLLTSFVHGEWTDKPDDLPEGAEGE